MMYNLWMSLNLEYLPLFIFVLTLTYKKKEKEKPLEKNKPSNGKNVWTLEEGWSVGPSVTAAWSPGPGVAVVHRPHPCTLRGDATHWCSGVFTQHIGTRSCGYIPWSHRPLSDTTFLCYTMQALWTGRPPGEASLFCVVSVMTTPKREEKRPLFPEDGNKSRSAPPQERTEEA